MICQVEEREFRSPIGLLKATACNLGLHSVTLAQGYSEKDLPSDMKNSTERANQTEPPKNQAHLAVERLASSHHLGDLAKWLNLYFGGTDPGNLQEGGVETLICPEVIGHDPSQAGPPGTGSFRTRVWRTLRAKVGFGQTVCYGKLAELTGAPGAGRAVGSAMAANPLVLVVPCHRVVRADGKVGNYCGGRHNHIKSWLLKHEHPRHSSSPLWRRKTQNKLNLKSFQAHLRSNPTLIYLASSMGGTEDDSLWGRKSSILCSRDVITH